MTPRSTLVADAAIALIAERGLRGLTHRAVDEAAALPPGSTSNLARTRAALLELALTRIAELEGGAELTALPEGPPREVLAAVVAEALHRSLTTGRAVTLARFELALEAARRPELREVYDRLGAGFVQFAAGLLARCGSADPVADARRLVRWCEGVLFNSAVGSGIRRAPGRAELRAETARFVGALLAGGGEEQ
ncbi:TetR/AcrR family transcriptional regulator [Kitasatospora viridis]|nr:TetR/AcrR family transcriptional regulator [Kitasatospora viridis]